MVINITYFSISNELRTCNLKIKSLHKSVCFWNNFNRRILLFQKFSHILYKLSEGGQAWAKCLVLITGCVPDKLLFVLPCPENFGTCITLIIYFIVFIPLLPPAIKTWSGFDKEFLEINNKELMQFYLKSVYPAEILVAFLWFIECTLCFFACCWKNPIPCMKSSGLESLRSHWYVRFNQIRTFWKKIATGDETRFFFLRWNETATRFMSILKEV